ncbi:MAG: hypothetical protein R2785_12170 [Flavobacteriaceae bacterium]
MEKLTGGTWAFLGFLVLIFIQLFTGLPIFPIVLGLVLVLIFGFLIIVKLDIVPNWDWESKLSKEDSEKTKIELNIDNKQWKKYSRKKKAELFEYYKKQNHFKSLTKKRLYLKGKGNINTYKKLLKFKEIEEDLKESVNKTVEQEWENLSLEERVSKIKEYELKIQEEYKNRKIKTKGK